MKARNNFNSNLNTGSEDNQVNNDDFTPVRNKRNKTGEATTVHDNVPNAPQKVPEKGTVPGNDPTMDEYTNLTPTSLTFDSTPLKKETTQVISGAPKKSRRNLDALGESISQPRFDDTNNTNTNTNTNTRTYNNVSRRDMSGLEEEILRSQNTSMPDERDDHNRNFNNHNPNQNGRNDRNGRNGRNDRNGYQDRRQPRYQPEPEPEPKKEQVLPSMNDSELFPTLGFSKSTEQKKVSVWSVFNPNLMASKEKEVIKTDPSEKQKSTDTNSGTNNGTFYGTYDTVYRNADNSEEEYSYTYNEEYDESYEDDQDEDSEQVYIRELYTTKYDLESKLEFLQKTYNKNNRQHVLFKHQLEDELADIENKIQQNDDLNTELDRIYAISYYQEPSPFERDKENRKMEEYNNGEASRTDDFFKMLASVR